MFWQLIEIFLVDLCGLMACAAFAHVTVLNNGTKLHFTWYIKVFQANIKFYQKVKIKAGKLLIPNGT